MSSSDIKKMDLVRWSMTKEERFRILKNLVWNHRDLNLSKIRTPDLRHAVNRASLLCFIYQVVLSIIPRSCSRYFYYEKRIEMAELTKTKEFIRSFCHEFTHHIQNLLYWDRDTISVIGSFKDVLEYEKEAGRFSYFVYKWFFKDDFPGLHPNNFKSYQNKYGRKILKETCKMYKENPPDC